MANFNIEVSQDRRLIIFSLPPHLKAGIRRETTCTLCGKRDDCLIIETMAPELCKVCLASMFVVADSAFSDGPAGDR